MFYNYFQCNCKTVVVFKIISKSTSTVDMILLVMEVQHIVTDLFLINNGPLYTSRDLSVGLWSSLFSFHSSSKEQLQGKLCVDID